jgi:Tat protein secretion system quality control protein TatD with DNase activity
VTYTAEKIARLRDIDFQEVARQTSENATRLFNLPDLKDAGSKSA